MTAADLAPLAVQLYGFRDPQRFPGSGLGLDRAGLAAIADAGFLGVETVDVPGGDPVAARRALDDVGLTITSAHSWVDAGDADAVARAADALAELGAPRMIVSGRGYATVAEVESFADTLLGAAAVASDRGLRFGYHNHDAELRVLDGRSGLEILADRTGDAIDFQVDIFWVTVGGADPASVISRLGRRVVSLHVKDGAVLPATAGVPFVNVAVGDGVIDPAPAVAAATTDGRLEWLIVEFDHVAGSALEGSRRSHRYLVDAGLARGRASA